MKKDNRVTNDIRRRQRMKKKLSPARVSTAHPPRYCYLIMAPTRLDPSFSAAEAPNSLVMPQTLAAILINTTRKSAID